MNYTDEQLQKAFDNQPETLQDYIMSDEVAEALHTLAEWFELSNIDMFSRAVLALLVGLSAADDFIKLAEENFGLPQEDAENLFGEVGDRIMVKAYEIYDQALKDAGIETTPISIMEDKVPSQTTTDASQQAPRPTIDIRRFVGIPAYGVEKPASSYTSILPHSDTEMNKAKDTPTADSFIQKLNNLNAVPLKNSTTTPIPKKEIPPIELSKLAGPVNIPRQEIKMPQNLVAQTASTLPVVSTTPTPAQPMPLIPPIQTIPIKPLTPPTPTPVQSIPSKPYSVGTDPYREPPTP